MSTALRARTPLCLVALLAPALLAACGSSGPHPIAPGVVGALPPDPLEAAAGSASSQGAQFVYDGHGVAGIPAEILARYAAPALPPSVSRRIQAMLDVRAPGAGVVSPKGDALYFPWTVTGQQQIWRLDGPQRFPVQSTGGEEAAWPLETTPDGQELVLARDRHGEENPGLYLQPQAGGPLRTVQHVAGVQTFFEHLSDDGRHLFYRANDVTRDAFAVYRFDLASGERERVLDKPGLWRVSDHQGGKLLLASDVGGNMSEYFEYDLASRELRPLFGQGERQEHRAAYGARPGEILVLTPKLGEFRRLYRFEGGKLSPVTPELSHDVSSFSIDRTRRRILYTVNEGGYTRLHAMDARTSRAIQVPALPEGDHVRPDHTTRDGRFTTVKVESARDPGKSFVIDWRTGKALPWHTSGAPEMDTRGFAVPTLEHYAARDGTKIPMFVRRPKTCDAPCPVIVSFHGGPESQAKAGFSARAQIFVDAGFVYAEPNVRGSDGYGKSWVHADDGPRRLDVITDIEDAAKHVRASFGHEGKPPRVGVMGGSYGGYSTLVAMTRFAGAYDAGAAVVGMSNLVTFLENTAPYRRSLRTSEYGDPVKDRAALLELSPVTHVDRVKAPILLIQGATDPRVPAGEAIQMHERLTARGVASELIVFPDEGHGAKKRPNQVLQWGHILRFFQENLQGNPG